MIGRGKQGKIEEHKNVGQQCGNTLAPVHERIGFVNNEYHSIVAKACSTCTQVKHREDFHRDSSRPGGMVSRCKDCVRLYQQTNRDKMNASAKRWRELNPEKAEMVRRDWIERNPGLARELHVAHSMAYNRRNPFKSSEHIRQWRENNPERIRHYAKAYKARKRGAEGCHALEEWEAVQEAYGHRCAQCGSSAALTKDHIIPLSKGGSDYIDNIQPLCRSCNSRKGAR